MTLPPPPSGNPGPPPQFGSGDPFGPPNHGGPAGYPGPQGGPPQHHAPQWQPPHQQPPAWAPNPGAQPPGPPPKKRGNAWKWGLGGVALLAVIGVTAAVSISVVKGNGGGGGTTAQPLTSGASQSPTASNSDIASANDTGPATIIIEDPTCAAWTPINNAISAAQTKVGWLNHDYKIPATEWTPELRETYETVSNAMTNAADQTVALARKTPHRLMRELYEQFIAYSRQFARSLDDYVAADNYSASAAGNASVALLYACQAIDYRSAAARAPYVPNVAAPTAVAKVDNPEDPQPLMSSPDKDCSKWESLFDKFNDDTKAWGDLDPTIPADKWNPDENAIIDAVIPVMKKYADDIESLGRDSSNPTIGDLAVFSAQYWRAYIAALGNGYTTTDAYLTQAASRTTAVIVHACRAFGG
jgi:hypothetical protein